MIELIEAWIEGEGGKRRHWGHIVIHEVEAGILKAILERITKHFPLSGRLSMSERKSKGIMRGTSGSKVWVQFER